MQMSGFNESCPLIGHEVRSSQDQVRNDHRKRSLSVPRELKLSLSSTFCVCPSVFHILSMTEYKVLIWGAPPKRPVFMPTTACILPGECSPPRHSTPSVPWSASPSRGT